MADKFVNVDRHMLMFVAFDLPTGWRTMNWRIWYSESCGVMRFGARQAERARQRQRTISAHHDAGAFDLRL